MSGVVGRVILHCVQNDKGRGVACPGRTVSRMILRFAQNDRGRGVALVG
jgi:hypothetical protein